MTDTIKIEAKPEEYLALVKANDITAAEAYLVEHFGVMGTETFNEEAYNQFAEATIRVVNEEAKAAVEAAKKEETTEEGTNEPEVQETVTDSEASN